MNAYCPSCSVSIPYPFDHLQIRRRVRAEFAEMPGMRVTLEQAMRLWSLNRETCESAIGELMASHFLERDAHGRYKRAHGRVLTVRCVRQGA